LHSRPIPQLTPTDKISDRARRKISRGIPWWSALAALAMLAGCAAGESQQYTPSSAEPVAQTSPAAASEAAAGDPGFTGLWEGTSTATCMPLQPDITRCNAVQKITLQMFQQGSKLTGHYGCAFGNMVCRDSNTTGTIADGKVRQGGVGMRVLLPDGSSCLFNGRPSSNAQNQRRGSQNQLTGSYFCMQGGGYIEQGRFQVERNY
jgi:hypothetical protein